MRTGIANILLYTLLGGALAAVPAWTQVYQSPDAPGATGRLEDAISVAGKYQNYIYGVVKKIGKGQIIPGLERELTGLLIGDQKEIHVAPEDGYGPRDPEASLEVPLDRFPDNITPAVGMSLTMKGPKGDEIPVSIVAVSDAAATLDFNHPLAGKALTFSVTVREIQGTNGTDRR